MPELIKQFLSTAMLRRYLPIWLLSLACTMLWLGWFIQPPGAYHALDWPERLSSLSHDAAYWRLFTPALLHYSFFHLLANLVFFVLLSTQWLDRYSLISWLSFISAAALCSNAAQALIVGPAFGGLSGVVYALFGFILGYQLRLRCAQGKRPISSEAEFSLNSSWSLGLLALLLLGFMGVIEQLANYAHAAGLLFGLLISLLFWLTGQFRHPSTPLD